MFPGGNEGNLDNEKRGASPLRGRRRPDGPNLENPPRYRLPPLFARPRESPAAGCG